MYSRPPHGALSAASKGLVDLISSGSTFGVQKNLGKICHWDIAFSHACACESAITLLAPQRLARLQAPAHYWTTGVWGG